VATNHEVGSSNLSGRAIKTTSYGGFAFFGVPTNP